MNMTNVLGLILGGGRGSRLYPLTRDRSKPAVPLAGKYRLIDIPMSNCFHAGIDKIAILTQFNSVSLHRHISRTYARDMFTTGWVQVLAAEQTPLQNDWYQGTADAVRKQMIEILEARTDYVLVLAGDHLYRMDYEAFAEFHVSSGADVSVAVQPVGREDAPSLGILKLDHDQRIAEFSEKPKDPAVLDGLRSNDDPEKPYMASMGIYLFKTDVLAELLHSGGDDFGSDIIPQAMNSHRVLGYPFPGFWQDIGTIRSFYKVNLQMADASAPFDFYSPDRPIYTRPRFLPGSQIHGANMTNVLIGDGCRIERATVRNAVVGLRSIIEADVTLQNTIMMGADVYEMAEPDTPELPRIGIGPSSVIERAIIDKNARIGSNVVIRAIPDRQDEDHPNWVSREGIVIIPKNAVIPDGTII